MELLSKILNKEELDVLKELSNLEIEIDPKNDFERSHFNCLLAIYNSEEDDISKKYDCFDFIIKTILKNDNVYNKLSEINKNVDLSLLISKLSSSISYFNTSKYKNILRDSGNESTV